MSLEFLKKLNGNNTGHFSKVLNEYKNQTPNIAWYPSARNDFRNLIFLSNSYSTKNIIDAEWINPDIFIYTDYDSTFFKELFDSKMVDYFCKPLPEFQSLMREYADLSGFFLFSDNRTSVRIMQIERLPNFKMSKVDLISQEKLVTLDIDDSVEKDILYLKLDVWSNKYGKSYINLIYINVVNEIFANELVQSNAELSHITKVRYGSAFGGARATGAYLRNILHQLKVKCFISDASIDNVSDRLPGMMYSCLKYKDDVELIPVHQVNGNSWSFNGTVSFYKVCSDQLKYRYN